MNFIKILIVPLAVFAGPVIWAEELLQETFDDGNYTSDPVWVTEEPDSFLVEDGRLKILNGGAGGPIAVELEKPATGPVEVAFELASDKASGDGHWIMISLSDNESESGYSISACNLGTMFGADSQASGFAWGSYGKVTRPGSPGATLNRDAVPQEITVKFNPEDQKITVEKDGEVVIEALGGEVVTQIDRIDFRVSTYPNGPARFIENLRVSQKSGSTE
jgi:hypothetical protein